MWLFKYKRLDYLFALTWTTDAFYRETKDKIKLRKEEGAVVVEMKQAWLIAVSKHRNIRYGAIIYGRMIYQVVFGIKEVGVHEVI